MIYKQLGTIKSFNGVLVDEHMTPFYSAMFHLESLVNHDVAYLSERFQIDEPLVTSLMLESFKFPHPEFDGPFIAPNRSLDDPEIRTVTDAHLSIFGNHYVMSGLFYGLIMNQSFNWLTSMDDFATWEVSPADPDIFMVGIVDMKTYLKTCEIANQSEEHGWCALIYLSVALCDSLYLHNHEAVRHGN